MIYPCWNFLVFPSSETLTSFPLLWKKKKQQKTPKAPSVNLIVCEHKCIVPWLRKKLILLKNTELLFLPLPKQQLSHTETDILIQCCLRKDCYSIGTRGSSTSGRRLLLLESKSCTFSCTSMGWSNMKSVFPWQPLAFQGLVHCPELLLSGVSLSLAGSSHSALGNRRQGTLFPTLIRQPYHSRKSVSFLKVSFFCGPVCPLTF